MFFQHSLLLYKNINSCSANLLTVGFGFKMGTAKSGRQNELSTATGIVIQNSKGKMLDYIRLPCDTEVTISFVVAGRKDVLKPVVFKTGTVCEPP